MGAEMMFIAVPLFLLVLLGMCLLAKQAEETDEKAEAEARVVTTAGALPNETLQVLPTAIAVAATLQNEPVADVMPLDELVENAVEDVVLLEADVMPLDEDFQAPEEVVLDLEDLVVAHAPPTHVARPGVLNLEPTIQLPLPLACEVRDPQLS